MEKLKYLALGLLLAGTLVAHAQYLPKCGFCDVGGICKDSYPGSRTYCCRFVTAYSPTGPKIANYGGANVFYPYGRMCASCGTCTMQGGTPQCLSCSSGCLYDQGVYGCDTGMGCPGTSPASPASRVDAPKPKIKLVSLNDVYGGKNPSWNTDKLREILGPYSAALYSLLTDWYLYPGRLWGKGNCGERFAGAMGLGHKSDLSDKVGFTYEYVKATEDWRVITIADDNLPEDQSPDKKTLRLWLSDDWWRLEDYSTATTLIEGNLR